MLYAASTVLLAALLLDGAVVSGRPTITVPAAVTAPRVQAPATPVADSLMAVTLHIEGMTCGGCAIAVRKVLARLDGVQKVDVTYETKRAVVQYDPAKVGTKQMVEAVETLRYTAKVVADTPAASAGTGP